MDRTATRPRDSRNRATTRSSIGMTDNQLSVLPTDDPHAAQHGGQRTFAQWDPLAELARLIGQKRSVLELRTEPARATSGADAAPRRARPYRAPPIRTAPRSMPIRRSSHPGYSDRYSESAQPHSEPRYAEPPYSDRLTAIRGSTTRNIRPELRRAERATATMRAADEQITERRRLTSAILRCRPVRDQPYPAQQQYSDRRDLGPQYPDHRGSQHRRSSTAAAL